MTKQRRIGFCIYKKKHQYSTLSDVRPIFTPFHYEMFLFVIKKAQWYWLGKYIWFWWISILWDNLLENFGIFSEYFVNLSWISEQDGVFILVGRRKDTHSVLGVLPHPSFHCLFLSSLSNSIFLFFFFSSCSASSVPTLAHWLTDWLGVWRHDSLEFQTTDQKNRKTKRKSNIVMSGQVCTLAMFIKLLRCLLKSYKRHCVTINILHAHLTDFFR